METSNGPASHSLPSPPAIDLCRDDRWSMSQWSLKAFTFIRQSTSSLGDVKVPLLFRCLTEHEIHSFFLSALSLPHNVVSGPAKLIECVFYSTLSIVGWLGCCCCCCWCYCWCCDRRPFHFEWFYARLSPKSPSCHAALTAIKWFWKLHELKIDLFIQLIDFHSVKNV